MMITKNIKLVALLFEFSRTDKPNIMKISDSNIILTAMLLLGLILKLKETLGYIFVNLKLDSW